MEHMEMPRTPPRTPNSQSSQSGSEGFSESPFDKKFLLTFDGGGIRGYASLLILQKLMELCEIAELQRNENANSSYHPLSPPPLSSGRTRGPYLPAHYFDYIAGTSTGGLIAIMLGRLRMTVDECLERYIELGDDIFGHPRAWSKRGPLPANRGKYSERRLERAIKEVIHAHSQGQSDDIELNDPMFHVGDSDIRCRVIIPSCMVKNSGNENVSALFLFRSYHHPLPNNLEKQFGVAVNPGRADMVPIWEVAMATTAAPTYFAPKHIKDTVFLDGGLNANNPSLKAFNEVAQMHHNNPRNIALTVSIGTGKSTKSVPLGPGTFRDLLALVKYSIAMVTESENTHQRMEETSSYHGYPYERFNPEDELGDIDLGEWKTKTLKNPSRKIYLTLASIENKTHAYLHQPEIQQRMEKVAMQLVEARQRRSTDPRWATAAAAVFTG